MFITRNGFLLPKEQLHERLLQWAYRSKVLDEDLDCLIYLVKEMEHEFDKALISMIVLAFFNTIIVVWAILVGFGK